MTDPTSAPDANNVPAAACLCAAGPLHFAAPDPDRPHVRRFSLLARSGKPIDHWYWGSLIHDLSGISHKPTIPLDYRHDEDEILGFIDAFHLRDNDLYLDGSLISFSADDRAAQLTQQIDAGIPYEASINFGGSGIVTEQLTAGQTATVNGQLLTGPATIIRKWPLRGVALTPYGADQHTSAALLNRQAAIAIHRKDAMTAPATADAPATNGPLDDAQLDLPAPDQTADIPANLETPRDDDAAGQPAPQADAARYLETFGDVGARWFLEGKSFETCQSLEIERLQKVITELNQRLDAAAAAAGESEPLPHHDAAADTPTPNSLAQLVRIRR